MIDDNRSLVVGFVVLGVGLMVAWSTLVFSATVLPVAAGALIFIGSFLAASAINTEKKK